MTTPTIIEAVDDAALWQPQFRDRSTWEPWFTFVKALFGLPLNDSELPLFTECTGRTNAPDAPAKEAWLVVGRRGGKSRVLALIAAYLAAFVDWSPYLVAGEPGIISVVASDRRQCRSIMSYLRPFLVENPLLANLVANDRNEEEVRLRNGIMIEVVTCSFRAVRGRTVIAALCDEAAFWASEDGSNPASEVIAALKPAMATIPRSVLLVASSPYARRGPLYDAWQRYFGQPGRVLIWRAATWIMNPMLSRESGVIAEAYEADPASAAAEYGAEFRSDLEAFVTREVVDAATKVGRFELQPLATINNYVGFYDAAGGSGSDAFSAAVAHTDSITKQVVIDAVREIRPPFSPEAAIGEVARLFKAYRIRKVKADRYAAEFPRELMMKVGISVEPSEMPASQIYSEFLPLLNSGRVELLDHERLSRQLLALERRTSRAGRDSISHPPGGHDDVINSVAGAAVLCGTQRPPMQISAAVLEQSRRPGPNFGGSWGGKIPVFF